MIITNNALLNKGANYLGPPVIVAAKGAQSNSSSYVISFDRVPDIGDLIVLFVTAGATTSLPTSVPSGFSLLTSRNSGGIGGSFVAACYYGTADGITNSFTFGFPGGSGTLGIAGYVIRYANGFDISTTNQITSSGTSITVAPSNQAFVKECLGIAFATTGNTSSGIALNNSFNGNLINISSPTSPERQALSGVRTFLSAATTNSTATWSTSRTAVSLMISVLPSQPS